MTKNVREHSEEVNRIAIELGGADVAARIRWPKLGPIYAPAIVFLVSYPAFFLGFPGVASKTYGLLRWFENVTSSTIGDDMAPPMTGRLPSLFYASYCSLVFIACVFYNVASALYLLANRRWVTGGCEVALQVMMARKNWSALKAWLVLRLDVYGLISALAAYCTFCLLNSVKGWFVFDVNDWPGCVFVAAGFCLPGSLAFIFWAIVVEYIVFDFGQIFKLHKKILR